ncbi:hypothetical protein M8J77_001471 [Diaphorina citri]|nr:hypothetical protein M8J77_001471 [Diaphorina citri]
MVRVSNILPTSYSIPNFSPPTPPKLPPSRSKTRRRPSTLTVLHHNIQSLRHKIPSIETFLNSLNEDHGLSPDILCFSETWLSPRTVNCVNIPGFVNVSSFYRQERQGGGVSVFVRDSLDFVPLSLDVDPVEFSFEFCAATSVNRDIAVICVYKSNNPESVIDVFFEGIEKLFSLLTDYRYLIVCGDFNIDTLVRSTALSTFRTILNLFNIKTCISSPTRITNTTKSCLDNILVNFQPKSLINDELNIFSGLRDHQYAQIISFHTNVTRTERVFTRKFSPHQIESFVQSLSVVDFSPVYTLSNVDDQSYLLNRLQRVKIPACIDGSKRDVFSSCLSVRAGVPQGSVLGPLLFLIYINDLIRCCQIAKFTLFADDTTILVSGQNHDGVISNCTKALEDVQIWFLSNKLQLNANKTSFLCFGNRTPTPIPTLTIPQSNLVLRQTTEVRFLGITMDAGLCWKLHIQALSSKLFSAVFALKSVRKNVDFRAGLSSYFAYFHSIMSYGILFWGFAAGTKDILLLQKRAVRAVFGLSRTTSCRPYFKDHNIPTFYAQLVLESVLAVRGLAEDLTKHSDVHNHDTRHKNKILNPLIRLTHPTHILLIHSTHILLTHSTHILLIHSTHILLIHTTHILLIHSTNILLIHSTHICSFIQLILCSFIQLTFCSFIQLIFCLFIQLIFYSFIQLTFCSFIQLTFCSFIQLIFCSFIQLIFCSFIQITFCSFIQITFCSFIQLTFCSFIHSPHSSN